jgi:predicted O-linked N-acetylglucosamine transferase (SPINDLY family)
MEASFASRVAASLLRAVDLPELVTDSHAAFEAKAIECGLHPEHLQVLRAQLQGNLLQTALFDTGLSTRHLEAAYEQVHLRHMAGLPAAHLAIQA